MHPNLVFANAVAGPANAAPVRSCGPDAPSAHDSFDTVFFSDPKAALASPVSLGPVPSKPAPALQHASLGTAATPAEIRPETVRGHGKGDVSDSGAEGVTTPGLANETRQVRSCGTVPSGSSMQEKPVRQNAETQDLPDIPFAASQEIAPAHQGKSDGASHRTDDQPRPPDATRTALHGAAQEIHRSAAAAAPQVVGDPVISALSSTERLAALDADIPVERRDIRTPESTLQMPKMSTEPAPVPRDTPAGKGSTGDERSAGPVSAYSPNTVLAAGTVPTKNNPGALPDVPGLSSIVAPPVRAANPHAATETVQGAVVPRPESAPPELRHGHFQMTPGAAGTLAQGPAYSTSAIDETLRGSAAPSVSPATERSSGISPAQAVFHVSVSNAQGPATTGVAVSGQEAGLGLAEDERFLTDMSGGVANPAEKPGVAASGRTVPEQPVARQVALQLAEAVRTVPDRPVEITLNPEELGRVRMTLAASEGTLSVTLLAERGETADLMRRHLETLAQEFRQIGYREVNFSFAGQDGGHPPTGSREADFLLDEAAEQAPEGGAGGGSPVRIALSDRMDIRL